MTAIKLSDSEETMSRWIEPVTLTGNHVRLRPVALDDVDAMARAAGDGELWKLWYTTVASPNDMRANTEAALARRESNGDMPFVVEDAAGEIVGSTRYINVDPVNQRLEIGNTWYAKRAQRSPVNTECKFLLLGHAFETLGAIAVEFRTHWHNRASQDAIARLGAKRDGVLRNHMKGPDGAHRDTVVFSIIESEWPVVRRSLQHRLTQPRQAPLAPLAV